MINTTKLENKLYGLDHLRALAILLVFFFHYYILSGGQPAWLPEVASFGWTGVDLFFVLSGFLIASQLFSQIKKRQPISLQSFYLKRIFRIIPALLFTIFLYFCIPFFREKEALPSLWKFLTFTQNFGMNIKDYGTFSHFWSLCVEEHFYLFLPLILLLLQSIKLFSRSYYLLLILFLLGLAIRYYCYTYLYAPTMEEENGWLKWYEFIYYPTYSRLDGLLAGVSIAAIYNFLPGFWNRISKHGNFLVLLGVCIWVAAYFFCKEEESFQTSVFGFPLIAIGFGVMVAGAVSPTSFLFKWNSKTSTFIATLSYAIYLTHKGVIHMKHTVLKDFTINSNLLLLICIVTCVTGAYLLHVSIERPFMRMRTKIMQQEKKVGARVS